MSDIETRFLIMGEAIEELKQQVNQLQKENEELKKLIIEIQQKKEVESKPQKGYEFTYKCDVDPIQYDKDGEIVAIPYRPINGIKIINKSCKGRPLFNSINVKERIRLLLLIGDEERIRELLVQGIDSFSLYGLDFNLIDYLQDAETVRLFIARGYSFSKYKLGQEKSYCHPLEAREFPPEIAQVLLENCEQRSSLKAIFAAKTVSYAKILIAGGVPYQGIFKDGLTPLGYMHKHFNYSLFDYLIEIGANINEVNEKGETLIFDLVSDGKFFFPFKIQSLAEHDADFNKPNKNGITPLFVARPAFLRDLIANGADVNALTSNGSTRLHYERDVSVYQFLIDHGANVNIADCDGAFSKFFKIKYSIDDTSEKSRILGK